MFFYGAMSIIGLGMLLRIVMYVQNRSLFIDEACLSSQLIERSYGGLFENMEYQYAPPFFAFIVKAMTQCFGANEYALRLIPLLGALIGIILFYKLCRKYLSDVHCFLPLVLFCFGMPLLQYATEVKQYSTDVMMTLALILICLEWKVEDFDFKRALKWALIGSFTVWFSMPGVFILFGIGIFYLFESYKKGAKEQIKYIIGAILIWLINFGFYYFAIIRKDIGLENLEDYHARFFLPLPPTSLAELNQAKNILLSFFQTSIGATTLAIVFGLLTTCMTIFNFFKKEKSLLLLFLLPILAAMLASGMKMYSLIPRLTLFFIPLLILLIGIGSRKLYEGATGVLKYLLIVSVLIILYNQKGYQYFYKPFQIEELRPVLSHLNQNIEKGDQVFLHYQAENAYVFYSQFYEHANQLNVPNIYIGNWKEPLEQIKMPESKRLWLIFSHLDIGEIERYKAFWTKAYNVEDEFVVEGARAVLFSRKEKSK